MVVVIIESDLAPGDHARIARQRTHQLVMTLFHQPRLMRMDADGGKNPGVDRRWEVEGGIELLGEFERASDIVWSVAIADRQHRFDAGSAGAGKRLRAIFIES